MSLKTCLHIITLLIILRFCLQCFDAVGWAAGRASGLLKTEWWGAGMVICLEQGADLHTAQLMQLPLTVTCFSEIQTGFTFLVPAHPGSHGQSKTLKHPLNGCLCVCYIIDVNTTIINCMLTETVMTEGRQAALLSTLRGYYLKTKHQVS